MNIIYNETHQVPEHILALRKKHHLSRRALASLLGVSSHWLKRLEEGAFAEELPVQILHRLCQIFDVDLEQLIRFTPS